MSITTKAKVIAIAPELATESDATFDLYIGEAATSISSSVFGTKTEWAASNWVAHYMSVNTSSGSATVSGPITEEKVGDITRKYVRLQNVSNEESDYGRTKYGRTFLTIRRSRIVGFVAIPPGR